MDDQILRFVYIEAMRDATLQKAYDNPDKKWLKSNEIYKMVEDDLKELVYKVTTERFKSEKEYDDYFYNVIKTIRCKINEKKEENKEFTFGNTQKLLNIMLKYFYIYSYNNDDIKSRFKYCHCPMDGQMMEYLWKNREKIKIDKIKKEFVISWGDLDFNDDSIIPEQYIEYQSAIREMIKEDDRVDNEMSPIEYDYYIWSQLE